MTLAHTQLTAILRPYSPLLNRGTIRRRKGPQRTPATYNDSLPLEGAATTMVMRLTSGDPNLNLRPELPLQLLSYGRAWLKAYLIILRMTRMM